MTKRHILIYCILWAFLLCACGQDAGDETGLGDSGGVAKKSGQVSSEVLQMSSLSDGTEPTVTPTSELIQVLVLTPEPTLLPEATPTLEPTLTPELTPTPDPTATLTPEPTATLEPTVTPTPEPTATPTPTVTPTPELTATPTPTVTPTPEPTATPTPTTPKPTIKLTATPIPTPKMTDSLKITMLDVGQGLSVLFESNNHYMLYDGGTREKSSYVVSYLKQNGVTELDYLVASHYDEDHIAGLVGVLNTATVKTAIIPNYSIGTDIYKSFMNMVQKAENIVYAERGLTYKFGAATMDILYGNDGKEGLDNNKSTVVKVSVGDFSCILTGDAEYDEEALLVKQQDKKLDCTLYVVGHHGSSSSSFDGFVKKMSPEIALISVGSDNEYGHPTDKTLSTLSINKATVYRTDQNGVITVVYKDGKYSVATEKNVKKEKVISNIPAGTTYVVNKNTKKFHVPGCASIDKMSEKNKEFSTKTKEELINEKYSPCKNCNP